MVRLGVVLLQVVLCSAVFADSIALKSGVAITECRILQENPDRVVILYGTGILRIDRAEVESISKDAATPDETPATPNHLPGYRSILTKLSGEAWAADLQQIPATVVSVGVMRNVPYKSHRAGDDYEINIYGDPSAPAGFEIGVRGALLNDEKSKAHCIEFVTALLRDPADRDAVKALKLAKDSVVRNGVTYEITPSTDPDSYGGWWISVYSETGLNAVRASDKELDAITVAKSSIAQPVAVVSGSAAALELERRNAWSQEELRRARVVRVIPEHPGAHDRVYSRDFGRHEGVYVPHHNRTIGMHR